MPESLIFLTENSPGVSNDRFGFMPLAALPMHQHINMLNFIPVFRLIRRRCETWRVLKKVTMGMGASIHISKA